MILRMNKCRMEIDGKVGMDRMCVLLDGDGNGVRCVHPNAMQGRVDSERELWDRCPLRGDTCVCVWYGEEAQFSGLRNMKEELESMGRANVMDAKDLAKDILELELERDGECIELSTEDGMGA